MYNVAFLVCRASPTMKGSVFTLRGRNHLLKTLHNVRVTLLCGLLTFILLRSSLGAGKFGTPVQDYDIIRHRLHSFKLRRQHNKLLLRRELAEPTPRKDASRSTLSLPTEEGHGNGALITVSNVARGRAIDNDGFLRRYRQRSPSRRPRILLVTGSHSCENAMEVQFLLKSLQNKMDYCRLHDIEIFHNMEAVGASARSRVLQELMLSHSEVEWIWWMDSLTIVTDTLCHPTVERYEGYNVVRGSGSGRVLSGKDGVLKEWEQLWAGGNFLLRNCEWSHNYLENAGHIQAVKFFVDTKMEMHEAGLEDGDARPFATHFGSCSLCGKRNTSLSCITQMERAFNFADSQKLDMGSL